MLQVNGQPTPDLDTFLAVVSPLKDGDFARVKVCHLETTQQKVGPVDFSRNSILSSAVYLCRIGHPRSMRITTPPDWVLLCPAFFYVGHLSARWPYCMLSNALLSSSAAAMPCLAGADSQAGHQVLALLGAAARHSYSNLAETSNQRRRQQHRSAAATAEACQPSHGLGGSSGGCGQCRRSGSDSSTGRCGQCCGCICTNGD
jgi:hypothetical protein